MQLVKKRDAHRRVTGLQPRVVYGTLRTLKKRRPMHLAYGERTHLTMRHFNSRLMRKSLAFSKSVAMHRAAAAWEDLYYNFAHPVKTLRVEVVEDPGRRWVPCTPAMAAELTLEIRTPKQLLTTVIAPHS